ACVDLHWEVDRDRRQRVDSVGGVGREDVRRGEVLRELRPCRGVTGIAQFPIEIPAACQTAHGRGAIADISTATTRDYQRQRARRVRRDVACAVNVTAKLV